MPGSGRCYSFGDVFFLVAIPTMLRRSIFAVPCLIGLAAAAQPVRAAELCLEDWSTAVPVVQEERLASVQSVMKLARSKVKGDVVKVTLCQQQLRWVYRLLVRRPDGKHFALIVDAKEPFAR
jgi:hypothetical protein